MNQVTFATAIVYAVASGIAGFVAIYQLAIHLRRRHEVRDLSFAMMAVAVAVYAGAGCALAVAPSYEVGATIQRLRNVTLCVAAPCLLWFLGHLAEKPPTTLERLARGSWLFVGLVALVERSGLLIGEARDPKIVALPFLEGTLIYRELETGPLFAAILMLGIAMIFQVVGVCRHMLAAGRRTEARSCAFGLAAFFATMLNDMAVATNLYPFIYSMEVGFAGLLLVMGSVLSEELVQAAQTRETLREREAWLRTLLESIGDAVVATTPGGAITHLNPRAEEVLGVEAEWALGKPLSDLVRLVDQTTGKTVEDLGSESVQRRTPLSRGRPVFLESADGVRRVVIDGAAPLSRESGDPLGAVVVLHDVTEAHHLTEQLQQAQKMELVGRLAGGVAHDFNNLLTPILGYAQVAHRKVGEDSPAKEHLEHVLSAAKSASRLTRQLLALSRKQVLDMRPIDVRELIHGLEPVLKSLMGDARELQIDTGEEPLRVRADAGQLEQVVMNLAVNARDAMPNGGKLLIKAGTVELRPDHPTVPGASGLHAVISATDTGAGIADEALPRLFEPFFTTKGPGEGTGLGLALVQSIVDQHGGQVAVDSNPGEGSTFAIFLPVARDEQEIYAPKSTAPFFASHGETVMVVEDEPLVRRLAEELLEDAGYVVLSAKDGVDAIEKARDTPGPIDLLLTDVVLPKMNGAEIAQSLIADRPEMRCLFMSGFTANVLESRGLLTPQTPLVEKPFQPETLLEAVRSALRAS